MNIFTYEVKSQARSFLVWNVALLLTVIIFMGGVYPIYAESAQDILEMMKGFPEGFLEAFGFNIASLFSYGGFYSFSYVYIALVASIMAVIVALSIFAREKKMKCLDFIFTKPIARPALFGIKTLASLSIVILSNIIYSIINLVVYYLNGQDSEMAGRFVLASFGLLFTQLVFLAIGVFLSTFMKKIRSVSGIATSVGFIAFILTALANLLEEEAMYFITPFKYFDPLTVMEEGHYEVKYMIAAIFVISLCMGSSYVRFIKSDVHAV
ncbi:MAG: hypothetical protein K0R92_120 [Lachnospiraceae bacterium]|jgi:ABC-2 type transport system permease protein|nr:hypothetical protein [Lachnospiraceae bacterium]